MEPDFWRNIRTLRYITVSYTHLDVYKRQALDLRCIRIRPECREVFEKIVGVPYTEIRRLPKEQPIFNITTLPEGADIRTLSLQLSEALRQRGRLLYLPEYPEEFKPL